MVMGRPNKGIDHVDSVEGSRLSKQRAKLILQTITGELSVQEACEEMGIQRPRFATLRLQALQGYVDAIEPGRPGRPRKQDVEQQEREAELLAKIASLERQLEVAETKALVAQIHGGKRGGTGSPAKPKRRR